MAKHAKLGPSSASRWLNCPGSVALCATVPEEPSSEYADEGTFAHDIAERAIRAVRDEGFATDVALDNLIGTESRCGRFQVDPAMAGHLKWYVRRCEELLAHADIALVESRVEAIPGKVWGTADFICVVGDALMVDDLKYGAGLAVSPIDNPQLKIYGLGAVERLRTTEPKIYEKLKSVRLGISQPRCPGGGGDYHLELAELLAWKEEVLLPGVAATEDPEAPLAAGDWCRFCPARATCPALREKALEAAQGAFSDVKALEPAAEPPSVEGLSVEQLGKALAAIPAVKTWIAAIDEHAYKLANRGVAIPGFKVVRKRSVRKWRDPEEAAELLSFILPEGVSPHHAPKLLSPAQAEKLLDKNARDLLGVCITSPDTGTVLVSESDSRPAISAGEVFEVLESGDNENE